MTERSRRFVAVRVLAAVLLSVLLVNNASAGTTQNSPGGNRNTMGVHEAFRNAGKVKGLEIWRIENFAPVVYPKNQYGKFYTGDSYIVLNTKVDDKGKKSWDVHFWLGLETSQDEAGSAAIFTVQLDDSLGGEPVQHREVQDHESQLFLSYFKNGLRYEPGGVASGFQHVQTNAAGDKRLFQVKGKKNVRVRQVALSVSSMNKGDCFILDAGNKIYVYVGKDAKRVEKLKAISAANQIRDQDHAGRATVQIVDEFSSEAHVLEFFEQLGSGAPNQVPESSVAEDDLEHERAEERRTTLYKISDAEGTLKIQTISEKPLKQEMLKTDDAFILDTGSGIYVWIGKKATQQEKTKAMANAQEFLKTKKYPTWTQVHRIVEGAETAPFKQYFATWRDHGMAHTRLIRSAMDSEYDSTDGEEFDAQTLHNFKKSGGRALGFMPDNGEGKAEIFVVQDFKLLPVDSKMKGMFFGGDSYVVKYEYRSKLGGSGYLIYYWQGKDSTNDEKAASAMFASQMDKQLHGKAVQIRVVQGHEPRHFLKIFKGSMIAFYGGHASGFHNIHDHDTYDKDGTRLFRIRGTNADDVRADQLPEKASSLASDDVFILETPKNTYIWEGRGGSAMEKRMAQNIVIKISPDRQATVIQEGQEPDDFWAGLGGKGEYDTELDPPGAPILEPRLFHCQVLSTGKFLVEEVHYFEQDDLDEDDIMVLDGGDEIYVWVGDKSTPEEKEKSIEMAKNYLRTDPTERNEDNATIITIHQGHEPRSKRFFNAWDDKLWEVSRQ